MAIVQSIRAHTGPIAPSDRIVAIDKVRKLMIEHIDEAGRIVTDRDLQTRITPREKAR